MAIVAVVLISAMSAFTLTAKSTNSGKRLTFYQYNGPADNETEIRKVSNYTRTSTIPCPGGEHVCGVTLTTDNGANSTPDVDEFNDVADQLWDAEDSGSTSETYIALKN